MLVRRLQALRSAPAAWRPARPGAIVRTEFDTVYVQPDVCNGCGYCVVGLPLRRDRPAADDDGRAWKCTLCYDRLRRGLDAGLRQGLPDRVDPVRRSRGAARAAPTSGSTQLHERGVTEAYLYGATPTPARHRRAERLLPAASTEPEVYNLPPDPVVPTSKGRESWTAAGIAAAGMFLTAMACALLAGAGASDDATRS